MIGWCDLSWREKCLIEEGQANPLKYNSGHEFRVKTKVQEGQESNERKSSSKDRE